MLGSTPQGDRLEVSGGILREGVGDAAGSAVGVGLYPALFERSGGVPADLAGDGRLCAALRKHLDGPGADPAGSVDEGILNRFGLSSLRVDEDEIRRPAEPLFDRGGRAWCTRCYANYHGYTLIW